MSDAPRNTPGTAAYYRSWAFRAKVEYGKALMPGQDSSAEDSIDDSADEDFGEQGKKARDRKSLVVVLSRTSARRATAGRKVDRRKQRANRRL